MKCSGKWGKSSTWPPTTAMVGSDSQRVGRSPPPPWSPRAVQARWMRFISPIRPSMEAMIFVLFSCSSLICLFVLLLKLACFETALFRGQEEDWRSQGPKDDSPKEEGSKKSRPGRKKTSPRRKRSQGRRRPPPRMMTRWRFEFHGAWSHGREAGWATFCLLAHMLSFFLLAHLHTAAAS